MSGTINISLQQQFDKLARPLAGGQLYFYQAASSTPQNAYKDTDLTLPYPNPITLDSTGRVPAFYLADGNIRVRLTDASGVVQIDEPSLLVIGPSSGSGGGSTVDATTLFQTGDVMWLDVTGVRTGWVRDNARTIGSATSGASERANSDCELLFAYYWQNFSDTLCPVPGGRGVSAAADWAANKQITTRDRRGKTSVGLDDMGNTAANRITAGTPTVAGSGGGEELHTLTADESAVLTYTSDGTDAGHAHDIEIVAGGGGGSFAGGFTGSVVATESTSTSHAQITVETTSNAGGTSHNNMQPYDLGTWYRKL